MTGASLGRSENSALSAARRLADQTFARAAGAPLIPGNTVRILRDAKENYPAWLEAIASATTTIHFETYIIHRDEIGLQFAKALADKARQGVRVRLLYDWLGSFSFSLRSRWPMLAHAGVEIRSFNPPRIDRPFGWISRDHRKVITIDGRVGFVSGLCVGLDWVGDPKRRLDPWRDTGIVIEGPAVADLELAFAETWAAAGVPLPATDVATRASMPPVGTVMARVVASTPTTAQLYRLDQLIAAGARRSLWLTDAYFVGTTLYVQALKSAATDGVDVRLLVPGSTDVPFIGSLSRAGYRPLLEAGVRVFEWNGSMLHAKTAVADSRWARVGSTNLNLTSWIGNWELDVAVEDEAFAKAMEEMYLDDLSHATEVVLTARRRVRLSQQSPRRRPLARTSGGRAAAGALGVGSAVGAAITNHRVLGPAEARVMATAGLLLLVMSGVAMKWPRVVAIPLSVALGWVALSLFSRAATLGVEGKGLRWPWRGGGPPVPPTRATTDVRGCASTDTNGQCERSEPSAEVNTTDHPTTPPLRVARLKRLGVYATVVFAAFLLGFIPMWMVAQMRANERDVVQQALRLTQLENELAAAAIQARRGDYEPAREAASTFYTNLRAELDRSPSGFTVPQGEMMPSLLAQRDQLITLLARADPAVADRLADAYVSYRQTTGTLPRPGGSSR
jgi:cardiolipin synthase